MAKKNGGKNTKSVPTQYDPAEDVEKLAKTLIPKNHSHLVTCKIAYLYKNKAIKLKGRDVAATAEKVPQKHRTLSGYHFLITVAYPTWKELDDKIRLAVLDHELEHCFVEDDEKTGEPKYSILPHDVEEFSSIILRHGLYTVDLIRLGTVVQDAMENMPKDVIVKKLGDTTTKPAAADEEDPVDKAMDRSHNEKRKDKPNGSLKVKKTKPSRDDTNYTEDEDGGDENEGSDFIADEDI